MGLTYQEALLVLGISSSTSPEEAEKAYKDLLKISHPDNFPLKPALLERATAQTQQINAAWDVYKKERNYNYTSETSNQGKANSSSHASQSNQSKEEEFGKSGSEGQNTTNRYQRPTSSRKQNGVVPKVILALLSLVFVYFIKGLFANSDSSIEAHLSQIASLTNKNVPMTVDSAVLLTNTRAGPGKRFTYYYNLFNTSGSDFDFSAFVLIQKPSIINGMKSASGSDTTIKYFFDNEVIIDFEYKDKYGDPIGTLEITPKDYR